MSERRWTEQGNAQWYLYGDKVFVTSPTGYSGLSRTDLEVMLAALVGAEYEAIHHTLRHFKDEPADV